MHRVSVCAAIMVGLCAPSAIGATLEVRLRGAIDLVVPGGDNRPAFGSVFNSIDLGSTFDVTITVDTSLIADGVRDPRVSSWTGAITEVSGHIADASVSGAAFRDESSEIELRNGSDGVDRAAVSLFVDEPGVERDGFEPLFGLSMTITTLLDVIDDARDLGGLESFALAFEDAEAEGRFGVERRAVETGVSDVAFGRLTSVTIVPGGGSWALLVAAGGAGVARRRR